MRLFDPDDEYWVMELAEKFFPDTRFDRSDFVQALDIVREMGHRLLHSPEVNTRPRTFWRNLAAGVEIKGMAAVCILVCLMARSLEMDMDAKGEDQSLADDIADTIPLLEGRTRKPKPYTKPGFRWGTTKAPETEKPN